jgi:hypothetical protein
MTYKDIHKNSFPQLSNLLLCAVVPTTQSVLVCQRFPPESRPLTTRPHLSAVLVIILRRTICVISSHNADIGAQLYFARCSGTVPASSGEISSHDDAFREDPWSEASTCRWKRI